MRIVFLGSPSFAIPSLRALADSRHEVVAVVSQPDRPAGRGRSPTPPPAKTFALERGLTVLQPANVNDPAALAAIGALAPDLLVVAAYGQILRQALLDLPRRGALNVHASLLPRHRGAAPIAAAILAGDAVTGVTIMEVVRALDAGPIVSAREEPISAHDSAGSLEARLAESGAALLAAVLDDWAAGRLVATPQDEAQSTYAPTIKRQDALIDWSLPAVAIWRRVRAYNPWPGAYTPWRGEDLRVLEAWPLGGDTGCAPGTVLDVEPLPAEAGSPPTFAVQAGEGRLAVVRAQRPGRQAIEGGQLLRGARGLLGDVLGKR
jgi:methionyl-tRNA formyltransferase